MKKLYTLIASLLITTSIFPMQNIKIETDDNKEYDTKLEYLNQSITIKDMLEEFTPAPTKLPLTLISSDQWNEIAPLLKLSYEIKIAANPETKETELISLITDKKDDKLKEIIATSFFLDIAPIEPFLLKEAEKRLVSEKTTNKLLTTSSFGDIDPFNLNHDLLKKVAKSIALKVITKLRPLIKQVKDKNIHNGTVEAIALNSKNTIIASGSYAEKGKKNIYLWDNTKIEELPLLTSLSSYSKNKKLYSISSLAFSPDDSLVASGDKLGEIKIWNVTKVKKPTLITTIDTTNKTHSDTIYSIIFGSNGKLLASSSHNGNIQLWNIENPKNPELIKTLEEKKPIKSIALNTDQTLLIAGLENSIKIWDIKNLSEPVLMNTIEDNSLGSIKNVAFGPEKSVIALGDETPKIWDISDLENITLISTIDYPKNQTASKMALTQDKNLIACSLSSYDIKPKGFIKVWNIEDLKNPLFIDKIINKLGRTSYIASLAIHKEYRTLVGGLLDGQVVVWYTPEEQILNRITLPQALFLYHALQKKIEETPLKLKQNKNKNITELYSSLTKNLDPKNKEAIEAYLKPLFTKATSKK